GPAGHSPRIRWDPRTRRLRLRCRGAGHDRRSWVRTYVLHVACSSNGGFSCWPWHGAAAGDRRCVVAVSRKSRRPGALVRVFAAHGGGGGRGGSRMVPRKKRLATCAWCCHDGDCNPRPLAGDTRASWPSCKTLAATKQAVKQPIVETAGSSRGRARGGNRLH